jgi:hypothetical protein
LGSSFLLSPASEYVFFSVPNNNYTVCIKLQRADCFGPHNVIEQFCVHA